jgi:hypothetical protein
MSFAAAVIWRRWMRQGARDRVNRPGVVIATA